MATTPNKTGEFTLTDDHITLLRELYIFWDDSYYEGAPAVNAKRPFGNSDWERDVAEHLDWGVAPDAPVPAEIEQRAMDIYRELETALQIVLRRGSFETGRFDIHWYGSWFERVGDA